jgi:hypothetical protein
MCWQGVQIRWKGDLPLRKRDQKFLASDSWFLYIVVTLPVLWDKLC